MHKANLQSQLRIFDTGSFARVRPHSNNPPERVHTGALNRLARTSSHGRPQMTHPNDRTNRQGRAWQMSCTNVHNANLGSQLSIFDTGSFSRPCPRPNDPPERVSHGRPQTTCPNDQNEPTRESRANELHERAQSQLGSQLSIFDMGSFARARPRRNDPPERVHTGALKRPARMTEMNRQGRVGQTSCTNVHKANLGSQLSIFDTSSFAQVCPRLNDPPERVHTGALKRPALTTRLNRSTRAPQTTRPNDPPKRFHTGTLKRPARTTHPNEFTRAPSNDPPERFCMGARTTETKRQERAGQTSYTNVHKANLGSQLSIFYTGSFAWAHTRLNDPPE